MESFLPTPLFSEDWLLQTGAHASHSKCVTRKSARQTALIVTRSLCAVVVITWSIGTKRLVTYPLVASCSVTGSLDEQSVICSLWIGWTMVEFCKVLSSRCFSVQWQTPSAPFNTVADTVAGSPSGWLQTKGVGRLLF